MMRSTCRYCNGTRMYIKHKCIECEGKGSTVQRKRVTVPVPAGTFYFCSFLVIYFLFYIYNRL